MSNTIKGFRGADGPILLDFSGVGNVPGAVKSIAELTAQVGDIFEVESVDAESKVATVKAVAKPAGDGGTVPTKVSAFENDAGYQTEAQVNALLAAFPTFEIQVVAQLPAEGADKTIYLVPFADDSGSYLEYLYVNGAWEVIGSGKDSGENLNLTVETITVGEDSGEPVAVTGLSLDLTSCNAKVGGGFYINPVVQPANATNRSVSWESDNEAVAAVNDMGYVECIAEGDAVITCTTVDGGFTATCAVSVAADESGGGDSGIKVYFKDSPHELTTGGILKSDGTLFDTADGAYLAIPYVEGIEIATCTNANWSVETYPHYLVSDNGVYTPVAGEATGVTAVTGAAQFVATFTGYGSDAVIYANINKYKIMQGTDANSQLYYYIIPGGES